MVLLFTQGKKFARDDCKPHCYKLFLSGRTNRKFFPLTFPASPSRCFPCLPLPHFTFLPFLYKLSYMKYLLVMAVLPVFTGEAIGFYNSLSLENVVLFLPFLLVLHYIKVLYKFRSMPPGLR